MLNAPATLYFQELESFYAALDEMQDGISQMAKMAAGAEFQPGLERYVEQMFSLGIRLERLFCLSHGGSLRVLDRGTSEINEELGESLQSNLKGESWQAA